MASPDVEPKRRVGGSELAAQFIARSSECVGAKNNGDVYSADGDDFAGKVAELAGVRCFGEDARRMVGPVGSVPIL